LVNLKKYKKVIILGGGISDEKKISDLTAKEVFNTLKKDYDVTLINVTNDCKKLIENLLKNKPNVVFNCLHGFFGEDGQIQSILNYLNLKYTHSGVMTSSILMNKEISKKIFSSFGVNSPKSLTLEKIKQEKFENPIIAKPVNGGSSNGLLKIKDNMALNSFLEENKKNIDSYLFEEFIKGREITVGVLNNKVSGIMEIVFDSELYDYNNKYIKIAEHLINPNIPSHIRDKLHDISINVHKGTNCNCISRFDFRYDEEQDDVFLLEVNTQPGLTKNSLLPEMAKKDGVSFFELCEILIKNSICENF